MTTADNPPKAFISYSWTSKEHETFVLELAERLMADGVHITLDKWDLLEGHDKYVFMEKMVTDPEMDKVLLISDKSDAIKADQSAGGVGTESQIISAEVYNQVNQEKFIPIVTEYDAQGDPCLQNTDVYRFNQCIVASFPSITWECMPGSSSFQPLNYT